MKMVVIDTDKSVMEQGKVIAHPLEDDGHVMSGYSYYLSPGNTPHDAIVVGFWHPCSKKRLKKWIQANMSHCEKYKRSITTMGYNGEAQRLCNNFIRTVEAQGDAAEVSLVHRRLV